MCLIMFKENAQGVFTNRHFKSMITRNQNGLGIMYIGDDNRVHVEKSVGTDKQKFQLWQKHKHRDSYAMHARLTTHGHTNLANCHPYKILSIDDGDARDLYMMHNGVLRDAPETDKTMSDTWHFVEYILKPIAKTNIELLWNNEEFQQWLQTTIKGSKLLFMRSPEEGIENNVLILNAEDGKEVDNCWLSNTYSTNETYTYNRPYHNGGKAVTNPPFRQQGQEVGSAGASGTTTTTASKQETTKTLAEEYAQAHKERAANHNYKGEGSSITEKAMREEAEKRGMSFQDYADEKEWLELLLEDERQKALERQQEEEKDPNKVLMFPLSQNMVEEPSQLLPILTLMKGQPSHEIKVWVKENLEDAADIILEFHKENTMSFEKIMAKLKDRNDIDECVDIIRHCASLLPSPRTSNTI